MKSVSYFKLQSKNLFHDVKLDFMQDDDSYVCAPRFFDVNAVINDFDVDVNDFSLMKAQHIIAKMVGMDSWKDLISASDDVLEQKKTVLDTSPFKLHRMKVYNIDLSGYEKIMQGLGDDYLLKCPTLPELEEIIKLKPNCYFMSLGSIDEIYKMGNDMKYIYVNVVPQTATIRVLTRHPKYPDWYAVEVKNIGKM